MSIDACIDRSAGSAQIIQQGRPVTPSIVQAHILILEALSYAKQDGAQLPSLAGVPNEEDVDDLYELAREVIAKDRFVEIEVAGEASFWALPHYFKDIGDFELMLDTVEDFTREWSKGSGNDHEDWQTVARQFGETSENLPERLFFFAKKLTASGHINWPLPYDLESYTHYLIPRDDLQS